MSRVRMYKYLKYAEGLLRRGLVHEACTHYRGAAMNYFDSGRLLYRRRVLPSATLYRVIQSGACRAEGVLLIKSRKRSSVFCGVGTM